MLVPYLPEHAKTMDYAPEYEGFDPVPMAQLLAAGHAFTLLDDGKPLCCAGLMGGEDGRYLAVALFAKGADRRMPTILRAIRRYLDAVDYNRVEAVSDCALVSAHRILRLVGFECEAPRMRKFYDGRDFALFARVR